MVESDEDAAQQVGPAGPAPVLIVPAPSSVALEPPSAASIWDRIKRHKVVEWTVAYIAFGYATLHGAEMLRDAFEWSPAVPRLTFFALALGLPIAITLAWYHGHRAQHRISRTELATLVALLLVAGSALWFLARTERAHLAERMVASGTSTPSAASVAIPEVAFAPSAHSVAVLPFTNLSGDPKQEYFSDGISEELINALSHIDSLAVAARTSSFSFKGNNVDIGTIARKLQVAAILEGSIRRSGNTIRITAQLINTVNGFHMWSENYDRDLKDVLELQTDIATAVAQQLKARLLGDEAAKIELGGTHIPEAYDAYLLGLQFSRHGDLNGFRRAIVAFHKATEIDAGYAAAYANLSLAEANAATYADYPNSLAGLERARIAAEKALALAPQLPEGYITHFLVRQYLLDFPGGRTDAARALALSPNSSRSQNVYGIMLATFGRLPEAIAAMNKAIELDPLNGSAWINLAQYLTAGQEFPAARQALNRAQALVPDDDNAHTGLGILNLLEGRHADALAEFQKCSDDVSGQMGAALVDYSRGNERQAQQALEAIIAKHAADAAYLVAEVYAWRGEKDKTFQWLERAVRQRDSTLNFIAYDPLLARVRGDHRYEAILKKLELLQ